ncbi:DMT family transporter [Streptomyces sp. Ru73]|uniref:DMT family transporter n=1 Tax=Streptomyces sp. Ru73 TaxID=2080748 RepID=UPI0021566323|nr:DMT family transporter [Streptomyces sp. Ru73]
MAGWGVAAALLANVLYSCGFVLEKRALGRLPPLRVRRPVRVVRRLLGSPLWLAGSLALAAGFAAQLVVYRTLPVAAAQGLFAAGLVLVLLLSSVALGERTTGRERLATVAVAAALVMVAVSLRGPDAAEVGRTARTGTLLACALPALVAGPWLYAAAGRRARRRHRAAGSGVSYGVAIGLLYGVSSLAIKGLAGLPEAAGAFATGGGRPPDLHALLAAFPALWATPYPYLLLCTGAAGLVLSQAALQRCRASLLVPVCTAVSGVFAVVCGTVAFGEPLPGDPVRLVLRLGGTALALGALLAMDRGAPPATPAPAPSAPAPAVVSGRTVSVTRRRTADAVPPPDSY